MLILVTGGAGFIGSHTCKQLAQDGFEVVVYDNLSTGHAHNVQWGQFVQGDLLDSENLAKTLKKYKPEAVIHFAASAYVGESVINPALYYKNNVVSTLCLLNEMIKSDVGTIVFSSTCATYGIPEMLPIREDTLQRPINPYGASKLMVERILDDYSAAYGLKYAALRYFNACGADPDGQLAEEHDPETHLIPRCLMAAAGLIPAIEIFGDDYPTFDGTCVRDYIHVSDLAIGHVSALCALQNGKSVLKLNLGSGHGLSIRQIIDGARRVTSRNIPYIIRPRRAGDPPELLADVSLAKNIIGFKTKYSDIDTILKTAWDRFASSA